MKASYYRFKEAAKAMENSGSGEEAKLQLKIIEAMTEDERKDPTVLMRRAFKQKQRIVSDVKCTAQDVNRLVRKL